MESTSIGISCSGEILEKIARHVETVQWEFDESVNLGSCVGRPAESFDMKTENRWQFSDPELLGAWLLRLARVAEELLRVTELFFLNKFL